jgi:hypothetical protein
MTSNSQRTSPRLRASAAVRRARLALTAAAALATGIAVAAPQLLTIEECLETGTREVSLPGSAGGSLTANTCAGCPTLRLRFDASTAYFVGKQRVSYTKFREAASREDVRLDVFYQPKTRVLTRLRIPAVSRDAE